MPTDLITYIKCTNSLKGTIYQNSHKINRKSDRHVSIKEFELIN